MYKNLWNVLGNEMQKKKGKYPKYQYSLWYLKNEINFKHFDTKSN